MHSLAWFAFALLVACGGGSSNPGYVETVPLTESEAAGEDLDSAAAEEAVATTATPALALAPAPAYGFDWGPPCRVPVTQRLELDEHRATLTFDLVIVAGQEANLLDITRENVAFVDINGKPPGKTKPPEKFFTALLLASAMPPTVVRRTGEWVAVRDVDQVIESMVREPRLSGFEKKLVKAVFSQPGAIAQIESKLSDTWKVWVTLWLQLALEPGERREITTVIPLADGSKVEIPMVVEHHGAAAGVAGHVRLGSSQVIDGELGLRVFAAQLAPMLTQPGVPKGAKLIAAYRTMSWELVTDPATMRPQRSRALVDFGFTMSSGGKNERHEAHEETFDWSKAQGCGR